MPAPEEVLNDDAVAGLDAPAHCGPAADFFDMADKLMSHDEGKTPGIGPVVDTGVAAADAAHFDSEQAVVLADGGQVEGLNLHLSRGQEDGGVYFARQNRPPSP